MISNENKIHLISQQIKGGVTPYSITTSPGIRYDLNDSDEHKQLKFNRYIIDDIMKSQKEYDVMDEKVNEHHVLDGSTRVKSGVAVGTRFKLSDLVECKDRDKVHDGLYAIRYDTHQFNWDSRHFCVYKSELFGPQRNAQLQFIIRWRDAFVRKMLKKSMYPIDSWKSGKQQAAKAESDYDVALNCLFAGWLKHNHLTTKESVARIESILFEKIGKLSEYEVADWVCNITSGDIRKMKLNQALCTSKMKVDAYNKLQEWIISDIGSGAKD
eukprot:107490_1